MARTGENIYKRKDGRWEARYTNSYNDRGETGYRSFYGKTYKEAKQKRLQFIHENMLEGELTKSSDILFRKLTDNWLKSKKLSVKESTYVKYCNQIYKHILPRLGKFPTSKITTELIEKLIGNLLEQKENGGLGLSPKTVEDILIIIKSILKFGKCNSQLELDRIKIRREDKTPLVLSKIEQMKLHQYLLKSTDCIQAGILISMHTGIRIGELCALQWQDIDLKEEILHIDKTIQRIQNPAEENSDIKTKVIITSPKSKKSIRDIHIPSFLVKILYKLKSDSDNFFLTGDTKFMEPRTLHNHFKKYLYQSGVDDYNFHTLRHTFATNYIEEGYDIKSLCEILGHSNIKITLELYVHSSSELKRTNIEKMAEKLLHYSPSKISSLQYAQSF